MIFADTKRAEALRSLIERDSHRLEVLKAVRSLELPQCWVGAGFVRNAVWDALHDVNTRTSLNDIDVIYYWRANIERSNDFRAERKLTFRFPNSWFSVKNQARMHYRNGDPPYESVETALQHWPETCTAVAVSLSASDHIQVLAPFGLDDLFNLVIRPTSPAFVDLAKKRAIDKRWRQTWPKLRWEEAW